MNEDDFVLVIGSAGIDIKAQLSSASLPPSGKIKNRIGGVARNIAENLARLEVPTRLLSVVGNDYEGQRIIDLTTETGVDCEYVYAINDMPTGNYVAFMDEHFVVINALADYEVMASLSPQLIKDHEHILKQASLVVVDATLAPETLKTIYELADLHGISVSADPTTPTLAPRLYPYLSQTHVLVPSLKEAAALLNRPLESNLDYAMELARDLVTLGVEIAVITLGEKGIAYAESGGGGYLRSLSTRVHDTTGAGDAFFGALLFALLNDLPVDEAMYLGSKAAAITLRSDAIVSSKITQQALFDEAAV